MEDYNPKKKIIPTVKLDVQQQKVDVPEIQIPEIPLKETKKVQVNIKPKSKKDEELW